jgi:hypothetical protein
MILSTSTLILIVTPTSFRYADQLLQDKAIWKGLKMWFHAIFIFLHFLGAFMWTEAREKNIYSITEHLHSRQAIECISIPVFS